MVSDLKIVTHKECKIAVQKKVFFVGDFRLNLSLIIESNKSRFVWYRLNVFLPQLPEVGYPKFSEIQNPWGKVMEISGLRFENFSKKRV